MLQKRKRFINICSTGEFKQDFQVSFDGEAGTGFGPTLEFYSTISKELQLASLKLWGGEAYTAINDGMLNTNTCYTCDRCLRVCEEPQVKNIKMRIRWIEHFYSQVVL